ncbi:MAG: type II/IV secretion system protein [Magnetococcales bacterium]|nr:type II/IV secretion system protein [Magnetococcales bacterium]
MAFTQEQLRQILVIRERSMADNGRVLFRLGCLPEAGLATLLRATDSPLRIGELDALRVGDLLAEEGERIAEGFQAALDRQDHGGSVAQPVDLVELPEEPLLRFLGHRFELPVVDLKTFSLAPATVRLVPEAICRRFHAVVLAESPLGVLLGMSDPTDLYASDEIANHLQRRVVVAVVNHGDLLRGLDIHYRNEAEIDGFAEELEEEVRDGQEGETEGEGTAIRTDAPVVKIIQSLFDDAVRMDASDIHIEPDEKVLRIRQRIDGRLFERVLNKKRIAPALISKIKLMAGLEISERRLAQDGRFKIVARNLPMDVRVSTMPTQDGESVVMRLLRQTQDSLKLDHMGLEKDILERLRGLLAHPHGMILVTGPTGSGKTTTLYGAINELNTPERKIITVEDPVEYRMSRVNQVQVMGRIGWDFAKVLRTALRQDPDVILVGEMRDRETAEIAIRAALTGHLVLSTLHTNDAVRTPVRLLDMGMEGYAVADSLLGILAQRLIRRVCPDCAGPHRPDAREVWWLTRVGVSDPERVPLVQGAGCAKCNQTGYRGRMAVMELLALTPELADILRAGDATAFIQRAPLTPGYQPIHLGTLQQALQGRTALAEAMRLCPDPPVPPNKGGA